VVLIYGDPGNGKSYLAKQLSDNCGYHLVGLDDAYIEFIKKRYPGFYLTDLNLVIAQHYLYFLKTWDRPGSKYHGALSAWGDWVASLAEDASRQRPLVAIEGYLLGPVLSTVQQRLADIAIITMVQAINGKYLVNGVVKSLEQICGRNDSADDQY
jgi:hypothetical protein